MFPGQSHISAPHSRPGAQNGFGGHGDAVPFLSPHAAAHTAKQGQFSLLSGRRRSFFSSIAISTSGRATFSLFFGPWSRKGARACGPGPFPAYGRPECLRCYAASPASCCAAGCPSASGEETNVGYSTLITYSLVLLLIVPGPRTKSSPEIRSLTA